jgi:hypothetical protein
MKLSHSISRLLYSFVRIWKETFYDKDTCISNIDNTLATKKRQAVTGVKTKSLHCPQLDHHDADGLAGHQAWRTTQTTLRRYKCAIRKSVHSS